MTADWRCPDREAPEPSGHVLPIGATHCSKCGQEIIVTFRPADHTSCRRRRFGAGCVPFNDSTE